MGANGNVGRWRCVNIFCIRNAFGSIFFPPIEIEAKAMKTENITEEKAIAMRWKENILPKNHVIVYAAGNLCQIKCFSYVHKFVFFASFSFCSAHSLALRAAYFSLYFHPSDEFFFPLCALVYLVLFTLFINDTHSHSFSDFI